MPPPADGVIAQKRAWAKAQGIPADPAGYTLELDDNLFVLLSDEIVRGCKRGDAAELGNFLTSEAWLADARKGMVFLGSLVR